jgi:hypothetical protein
MSTTARKPSTIRPVAATSVAAATSTTGNGSDRTEANTSTPIATSTEVSGAVSIQGLSTRTSDRCCGRHAPNATRARPTAHSASSGVPTS